MKGIAKKLGLGILALTLAAGAAFAADKPQVFLTYDQVSGLLWVKTHHPSTQVKDYIYIKEYEIHIDKRTVFELDVNYNLATNEDTAVFYIPNQPKGTHFRVRTIYHKGGVGTGELTIE